MSEQNSQDTKEKIESWVSDYYFGKAYLGLREANDYSKRMMVKSCLILLGLMAAYLLFIFLGPGGYWTWIAYGIFVVVLLPVTNFFKRKTDRYRNRKVPSSKTLEEKIKRAMQVFPLFTDAEKEKLLNLIAMGQDKSVTKETFRKELGEALKLEGLKKWIVLQEISQELNK